MLKKKILIAVNEAEKGCGPAIESVTESCRSIKHALSSSGYSVFTLKIKRNDFSAKSIIKNKILKFKPDCIFNLFEGFSNDSKKEIEFAEIIESTGIRFTGCRSNALKKCLNKHTIKNTLKLHGVIHPSGFLVKKISDLKNRKIVFPAFIKPACEDASISIDEKSLVYSMDSLKISLTEKLRNNSEGILIEEFLSGSEYNASFIGTNINFENVGISILDYSNFKDCLPFLSYQAKWNTDTVDYKKLNPSPAADIPLRKKQKIIATGNLIGKILGLSGYYRVDFREKRRNLYVIDINPNPDISEDSGFMKQARVKGWTYVQTINIIVETALS